MGSPRRTEKLLFETFLEASLFARQLAQRSGEVVRFWPDDRGWLVENIAVARKTSGADFLDWAGCERPVLAGLELRVILVVGAELAAWHAKWRRFEWVQNGSKSSS